MDGKKIISVTSGIFMEVATLLTRKDQWEILWLQSNDYIWKFIEWSDPTELSVNHWKL